jgi:hypothetical protein
LLYRLFDIVTIGIPFGIFKITSGLYFGLDVLKWWGILDLFINTLNFLLYLIKREKIISSCALALMGRQLGKILNFNPEMTEDIGESLDVLFSFLIVAIVIGSGAITKYSPEMIKFWNISVILNVLGAGSFRVFQSVKKLR